MRRVLSREQARIFDRYATESAGVPSQLLMENAGRGAAEFLLKERSRDLGVVLILAGPGNNGGDGFVLGRRLRVLGQAVEVWFVGDPIRVVGDAAIMRDAYTGIGGDLHVVSTEAELLRLEVQLDRASTIVDALFGTGLARSIDGIYARIIDLVNTRKAFVLSLDIPSGLDANTGCILGAAVRADVTVTFGTEKLGHFSSAGVDCSGRLEVVDIGVPLSITQQTGHSAERFEGEDLAPLLPARLASSHKGRAGRVAIVAGHAGTTGAALLAARGALRMGAGLVTHLGLAETISSIESRVLEAMTQSLDRSALEQSLAQAIRNMNSIVIGPGLGLGDLERRIVEFVVEHAIAPVVIDADALTILADESRALQLAAGPRILLPHRGELARLLKRTTADIEQDPFSALAQAVELTQSIVVLKGACSYVGAPNQKTAIVGSPCPALGTAGSGDVLSGVIGALAVDHSPFNAAVLGVHLHGRSGISWSRARGVDRGMLASDIADNLPIAVAELARPDGAVTV
jgi:ADP-dependent NAD(P)H-hydrate dehydratase / NAD(P)H-hydrate epimerase